MNKLQRFIILSSAAKDPALTHTRVIGTNSGQAFVEAAADKHASRLRERYPHNHYSVVEITKLKEII